MGSKKHRIILYLFVFFVLLFAFSLLFISLLIKNSAFYDNVLKRLDRPVNTDYYIYTACRPSCVHILEKYVREYCSNCVIYSYLYFGFKIGPLTIYIRAIPKEYLSLVLPLLKKIVAFKFSNIEEGIYLPAGTLPYIFNSLISSSHKVNVEFWYLGRKSTASINVAGIVNIVEGLTTYSYAIRTFPQLRENAYLNVFIFVWDKKDLYSMYEKLKKFLEVKCRDLFLTITPVDLTKYTRYSSYRVYGLVSTLRQISLILLACINFMVVYLNFRIRRDYYILLILNAASPWHISLDMTRCCAIRMFLPSFIAALVIYIVASIVRCSYVPSWGDYVYAIVVFLSLIVLTYISALVLSILLMRGNLIKGYMKGY